MRQLQEGVGQDNVISGAMGQLAATASQTRAMCRAKKAHVHNTPRCSNRTWPTAVALPQLWQSASRGSVCFCQP